MKTTPMIYGDNNPAIREIIYALDDERQWLELVREDGKPYTKLIDFLLSEPVHDDDTDPELLKSMTVTCYAARLGEKQATVNKWLRQIYTDIFELNQKHPELFVNPGEQLCSLHYYCNSEKSGFLFYIGLKCIPRVGDEIDFYFPRAVVDSSALIVKEITHKFEHGTTVIEIELGRRYYKGSSYRNLLIDKALFMGWMQFEDIFLPDYELDAKLKKEFGHTLPEYI